MIRKTLTILSLLVLLLSVGLWGMSCHDRGVWYEIDDRDILLADGRVLFTNHYDFRNFVAVIDGPARHGPLSRLMALYASMGGTNANMMTVHLWVPTLLSSTLLIYQLLPVYKRRKRKKLVLCVKCGYNLRGLTKPRCPECNTPFDERLLKKDA